MGAFAWFAARVMRRVERFGVRVGGRIGVRNTGYLHCTDGEAVRFGRDDRVVGYGAVSFVYDERVMDVKPSGLVWGTDISPTARPHCSFFVTGAVLSFFSGAGLRGISKARSSFLPVTQRALRSSSVACSNTGSSMSRVS